MFVCKYVSFYNLIYFSDTGKNCQDPEKNVDKNSVTNENTGTPAHSAESNGEKAQECGSTSNNCDI